MARLSFLRISIAVLLMCGVTFAHAKTTKRAGRVHLPVKATRVAEKVDTPIQAEIVNAVPEGRSDTLACRKVRRRLWLDDQGWIVRQVAICS